MKKLMTDKELIIHPGEENTKLRGENQSLYGKLGAQGLAISRAEKYQALELEVKELHTLIEQYKANEKNLLDEIAISAMQGMIDKHVWREINSPPHLRLIETLAGLSYDMADAMLKEKRKRDGKA